MLSAHKTSIPCSWKSCYRKTWKAGVEAAVYMRCWWSLTIFFFFGSGQQALGEGGERRKDFFHFEAERGNKLRDWKVLAPLHWECHGWWWWACMFSGRMMYKGQIIWLVLCQQLVHISLRWSACDQGPCPRIIFGIFLQQLWILITDSCVYKVNAILWQILPLK